MVIFETITSDIVDLLETLSICSSTLTLSFYSYLCRLLPLIEAGQLQPCIIVVVVVTVIASFLCFAHDCPTIRICLARVLSIKLFLPHGLYREDEGSLLHRGDGSTRAQNNWCCGNLGC